MTSRAATLFVATAAVVLVFGSLPAEAAMPVPGPAQADTGRDIVQVAKKKKKSRRQKEIDKSVDSGTVPKRFRSSVPKQYHHLIPFAK